jgi:levanbiose-producing levanase
MAETTWARGSYLASYFFFVYLFLFATWIPLVTGQTRPNFHLTPTTKWMNDPQRPVYSGEKWHFYYLYNSNWDKANPGAGGTEWYHVTSLDMIHWAEESVAIQKYQPNPLSGTILGDIETGSAVVDVKNSAGFGQNAVIALLTQMQDGIQQQSLFHSNDNGYTFTAFDGNPVMPSPDRNAKPAFRDPKVFWDNGAGAWMMALAEGSKIGFYTSKDLKSWSYVSGFFPEDLGVDLGTLECPDMFQIDLDGNSASRSWILAMGGNGYLSGRPTGTAYWVGTWNGTLFTAKNKAPQWMDDGPDFYATVSWENPRDKYGSRYAIAWMNNWDYAANLPYYGGYQGQMSLVREVKLRTINGMPRLVSLPIAGYESIFQSPISIDGTKISTDPTTASLPSNLAGGAYMIRATVSKGDGDSGGEVHIRIKSDGTYNTTIGYNFAKSQVFLGRSADGYASDTLATDPKRTWDAIRTADSPARGSSITLTIYVDYNSVETFINDDGVSSLSGLIYPNQGAEGIEIISDVGTLTLTSFTYSSPAT